MEVSKDGTTTNKVAAIADLKEEKVGWCQLEYGYDQNGDYVVHFSSHHEKRLFPQNLDYIYKVIIGYLDKVIPADLKKDFFPSPENWEKKVITVKVIGAQKAWNFQEDDVVKQLHEIGKIIDQEVTKANPPKRLM